MVTQLFVSSHRYSGVVLKRMMIVAADVAADVAAEYWSFTVPTIKNQNE
jgi:hypothetical protein